MRQLNPRKVSLYNPPPNEKKLRALALEQGLKLTRSRCGLTRRWVLRRADRWAKLGSHLVYRTLADVAEALEQKKPPQH